MINPLTNQTTGKNMNIQANKLASLRLEIPKIFQLTRLNRVFGSQSEAVADFE